MKLYILFLLSMIIAGQICGQNPKKGLSVITPGLLRQHINYLASDSMKGRNTPSPELDKAAGYIAAEFASLGIRQINNTWFQQIPLITRNIYADNCRLEISLGPDSRSFQLKTEYTPFEMTADTVVESPLVFAGYGITALEYQYDDYANVDVKGKIVLILKHEPGEKDSASRFDGIKETRHSLISTKVENAQQHGAIGLLIVTDPLNHLLLTPQGYPWPALSKFLPQDNLPVELDRGKKSIPVVQAGEAVMKYLFGSTDSLKKIQKRIDLAGKPASFTLDRSRCRLETRLKITRCPSDNVIGYIEGRNPEMKGEYVIIGGHYDHVGYRKIYQAGEDYIFNGADDNASGTAGVMAIARAFSVLKRAPERSVVFVLFAGEEKGLFGSRYYCDHPLVPMEKCVVMLNLDMISRNGPDSLQLDGLKQNPDLAEILLTEAQKLKLKNIPGKEDLFQRSDHYSFFRKGVSALNITSGLHDDYHMVSDNPDAADTEKAARISRMTFMTAWKIANEKIYLKTVPLTR